MIVTNLGSHISLILFILATYFRTISHVLSIVNIHPR